MSDISVGVVGLGYWGPNLLRNFRTVENCRVVAMADANPKRLESQGRLYPDVRAYGSADELIADDGVDAIAFALPAGLIPDLATSALERGKHVMVEKPMAHSLDEGLRMLKAVQAADRVGMVDFTFVYSPPVRYLHSLLESGSLGGAHYYQSTRINLGRFQPDVDVIWDLVVHDVAILLYLFEEDPVSVIATGRGISDRVDTAQVTLMYENGLQAFVHVSWMAPMKIRTSMLACEQGMVVYNDVDPDEKVRVYRAQGHFNPSDENSLVPTFRLGDVTIPRLPQEEPLQNVGTAFIEAIRGKKQPTTTWEFGVRVLAILEAARESLSTGQAVDVPRVLGSI